MANLTETTEYDEGVYQIETTDPVLGGPNGIANAPLKNLANRTAWLKQQIESLEISDIDTLQTVLDALQQAINDVVSGGLSSTDVTTLIEEKILNTLTSTLTNKALSANQGRILKNLVDDKASSSHSHSISNITNLQSTLNGKASTSHTHSISNVSGLQTALDGKASTSHTHSIANITNLQTTLNGKASTSHTHPEITGKSVYTRIANNVASFVAPATGYYVIRTYISLSNGGLVTTGGNTARYLYTVAGKNITLAEYSSVWKED